MGAGAALPAGCPRGGEQPSYLPKTQLLSSRWNPDIQITAETCRHCPSRAAPGALPLTAVPFCRSDQFWVWMSQVFLPYLYNNRSGQESHSTTLGAARLRQLRLQEGRGQQPEGVALPGG